MDTLKDKEIILVLYTVIAILNHVLTNVAWVKVKERIENE